ncbi:hypothetical protein [Cobetia amphilecti]|uniref:hypothetical protein n=1 Tax=Cobetia amphilecti TaxID=1055104 RepID=UPI0026E30E80|nr:hypothetical protein [Cobetia amphilecti]MDO6815018.1 hypothetical protein [Cobetia amphilecti]
MKKLFIHFGMQRTGTTTIQSMLTKNKGILRSHGILYPRLFNLDNHVKIPWWLLNNKITSNELLSEIKSSEEDITDTIVLSAEDFCLLNDLSFIQVLQEAYDVNIVLYLKEQSAWLESWYNQNIKWPWNSKFSSSTPEFFLNNISDFYWLDYYEMLKNILNVVGKDKIHLAINSKSGVIDTAEDFFNILGINTNRLHPYKIVNESLTASQLEVVRRIDLINVSGRSRTKILQAVKDLDLPGNNVGKKIFNQKQVDSITNKYLESNKMLSKVFFDKEYQFEVSDRTSFEPIRITSDDVYKKYIPALCKVLADKS